MNSVNEAIATGVPLLCFPLFGDQFYNAAAVAHRDIGLTIKLAANKIDGDPVKPDVEQLYRSIISALDALLRPEKENRFHLFNYSCTYIRIPCVFFSYKSNIEIMKQKLEMDPMKCPDESFVEHVVFAAQFDGNLKEFNIDGAGSNSLKYIL